MVLGLERGFGFRFFFCGTTSGYRRKGGPRRLLGPKALSRRGPHRTPWHRSFETPWTWADASRRRRCRRCDPGRTRREKGDARRYAQERGRLIGDRSMPPGAGLPDGETCETRAGHEPVCRSTAGACPPERDLQTRKSCASRIRACLRQQTPYRSAPAEATTPRCPRRSSTARSRAPQTVPARPRLSVDLSDRHLLL